MLHVAVQSHTLHTVCSTQLHYSVHCTLHVPISLLLCSTQLICTVMHITVGSSNAGAVCTVLQAALEIFCAVPWQCNMKSHCLLLLLHFRELMHGARHIPQSSRQMVIML